MKERMFLRVIIAISIVLILTGKPVQASSIVRYVSSEGCGLANPCYATIQSAIDAASAGDEIRVAAGTYTIAVGENQVVFIDKSITLRGGFTTADWEVPYPELNPTELNAMTLGRVAYISGANTTATLEGLYLTYGDSNGLASENGAGIYVYEAMVFIDNCVIRENAAPSNAAGGGIYLRYGSLSMNDTVVELNEAGSGGGIYLQDAVEVEIISSLLSENKALATNGLGAGMFVDADEIDIQQSLVENNENTIGAPYSGSTHLVSNNLRIWQSEVTGAQKTNGIFVSGEGSILSSAVHKNEYYGLRIGDGIILVEENEIYDNCLLDGNNGGGVSIIGTNSMDVILRNNYIHHNHNSNGSSNGAGIFVDTAITGQVSLIRNIVTYNQAGEGSGVPSYGKGGGVYLIGDNILLDGNILLHNTAYGFIHSGSQYWGGDGGGVYINDSPVLQNNIIANNVVIGGDSLHFNGPGIYVNGGSPDLYHNTLVANNGGDGVGLYVIEDSSSGERSQVQMINGIVASQTVGIYASGEVANNVVIVDGILWSDNGINTGGTGTFFINHAYTGDPAFVAPEMGDYHIQETSPAINKGIPAGILRDVDNELRFAAPDLGADEYIPPGFYKYIFIPVVLR